MKFLIDNFPYLVSIIILCMGLYMTITEDSLIKKMLGLGMFQSAILIFFTSLGKIKYGMVPVANCAVVPCNIVYTNPLPHVLMLTAIVVGVATLAVGTSFCILIQRKQSTISASILTSRFEDE